MPGGESTTMTLGVEREGLAQPLRAFHASGRPIFGTCAGLIMLDRSHLGLMDIVAQRNAFGRQVDSFEADLDVHFMGFSNQRPFRAIFIRAPIIEQVRGEAQALITLPDGRIVAAQQGRWLATSFHPELTGDDRFHRYFLELVR